MTIENMEYDLRKIMHDAHAHFFFLKGNLPIRLKIWDILEDSIVIDRPVGAPMRRTVLGYIPTLDCSSVYEIDGQISLKELPDQMPGTVRIMLEPSHVKKVNKRLYPRVNFTPPVSGYAAANDSDERTEIRIVNLSAGGIRIESVSELQPQKTYCFDFKFDADGEEHRLCLNGRVAYELPFKNNYIYGVSFRISEKDSGNGIYEAPLAALDQTIDLLELVNKLLVQREAEK